MTRTLFGTTAVLACLALPVAAQITAEDVWDSQTAVLTALGVTPAGSLTRDGAVVTVSDAGGSWALPLGSGMVSWRIGDYTLTDQDDGSVLTSLGDALAVTFDLTVSTYPGMSLSGDMTVMATGFARRWQGTPEAIMTTTTADAMTFDLTDLRSPDLGSDMRVNAFLLLEGFESVVTITRDGNTDIESRSQVARMVTDFGVTGPGFGSRDVGEWRDSVTTVLATLPQTPLDPLNLGPALRNGLALQMDGTTGAMRSQTVTRGYEDEILSDQRQTVGSTTQSLFLTAQDGLGASIGATDVGYKTTNPFLGVGDLGVSLDSLGFDLSLPLLAGQGQQAARLGMDLAGLRAGRELFALMDLPGDVFDHPGDFAVALRAEIEPVIDLTDVMALGAMIDRGESPLRVFGVALETLVARWDGAELTGSGAFGWDADGELLTETMDPPQGEATFDMIGAYAVIDRLAQAGALPPDALLAVRGALAGFGRPVGEDHLRSVVALGPDGMRVNGAPVPF